MNTKFEFKETEIKGLWEIIPFNMDDIRGSFTKDYSKEVFETYGITHELKEVFYTTSYAGVLRGMHFQREKQQPKLVRCISGRVYDVVVDLRVQSPTFKQWKAFELTGSNQHEILVPAGCAHGYLVLEESVVSYKCGEKFYGEYDDGIMWNDSAIGINWPLHEIEGDIILSEKDKNLQSFELFMTNYGGF